MNGKLRLRKTMAALAFSVCGTAAHADAPAYSGPSVSSEPYAITTYVGGDGKLGVWRASLEVESQLAIDLLTQQLTAARPAGFHQFEGMFLGPDGAWNQKPSVFPAEKPLHQLATLETESSKAIEDMKRLLQQGQLPSNVQSFKWERPDYDFSPGVNPVKQGVVIR